MAQILEAANEDQGYEGIRKTHIMYKANLSYGKIKEYLKILTDNGLLNYDLEAETFKTTANGFAFLQGYSQIDRMLKEQGI